MIERTIPVERIEDVINVFGSFDQNLRIIEQEYNVTVLNRDNELRISGDPEAVMYAERAINGLLALAAKGEQIDSQNVRYIIKLVSQGREEKIPDLARDVICVTAKGKPIPSGRRNMSTPLWTTPSPWVLALRVRARPIWRLRLRLLPSVRKRSAVSF